MSRLDTITRAFLRYLYEDTHFRPEVRGFLDSARCDAVAPPVQRSELADVVERLRHHDLIAVGSATADGIPLRAGLTGAGLICAGHHDGDLHAWRNGGTTAEADGQPHPESTSDYQPVPIMVAPHHADEVSLDGLARVARVVLLTLPTVHERYEDDTVGDTARDLLDIAREPDPDIDRVRALAHELRTELRTGSVANTLGVVLLDSLDEAMVESRLS